MEVMLLLREKMFSEQVILQFSKTAINIIRYSSIFKLHGFMPLNTMPY